MGANPIPGCVDTRPDAEIRIKTARLKYGMWVAAAMTDDVPVLTDVEPGEVPFPQAVASRPESVCLQYAIRPTEDAALHSLQSALAGLLRARRRQLDVANALHRLCLRASVASGDGTLDGMVLEGDIHRAGRAAR